jgi:N-acyl-D-amino-acid deacylase
MEGRPMRHYELLIKNGQVFDGSGSEPFIADIGVQNGKIAAIEPSIDASADQVIDAAGKIVTPGFIDVHTHYDGQATWDEHLAP